MKTVLKVLTLAAIAVVASVQHASAQYYQSGLPFVVIGGVTSNLLGTVAGTPLDVSAQRNVAIKWTFGLTGAGTEVMGLRFQPSMDGTLPTTPAVLGYQMAIAANGATPVIVHTNFDTLGYRFLIPVWLTNGNATLSLTNMTIDYLIIPKGTAK